MQDIAQSWLVWHLTNSPFLLGLVGFFDTIPRLLFGAIGGAIVDRMDRRRLLILTQTLAMGQAFVYWFAVYYQFIAFWHVLLLTLFLGIVNSINQTLRQSLVNSLVPKDELLNAIALHSSMFNLSRILGPSIGGVLIAVVGIAGCFFINGLSFLAIIFSVILMELPPWDRPARKAGLWSEIKEGARYVKGNRNILSVFSLSYIVSLVGAPYSRFLPVFATNVLHVGALGFGLLTAAPGIGATASSLVVASVGNIRPDIILIAFCVLGFALFLALFAFSHSFVLSLGLLILSGFCLIAFRMLSNTAIQMDTPPVLLGRVLSFYFMDRGLWSLGGLLIGSSVSLVGVAWAFAGCACTIAVASTCVLIWVGTPSQRRPRPSDVS
jgi:MFS family permease